jgi:hypothetical protein
VRDECEFRRPCAARGPFPGPGPKLLGPWQLGVQAVAESPHHGDHWTARQVRHSLLDPRLVKEVKGGKGVMFPSLEGKDYLVTLVRDADRPRYSVPTRCETRSHCGSGGAWWQRRPSRLGSGPSGQPLRQMLHTCAANFRASCHENPPRARANDSPCLPYRFRFHHVAGALDWKINAEKLAVMEGSDDVPAGSGHSGTPHLNSRWNEIFCWQSLSFPSRRL